MKTYIIFIGIHISPAVNFTAQYLKCSDVTEYSCSIDCLLTSAEKERLTNYLDRTYSTSPIFVEATKEEIDNIGNSLTLKIKQ